ncbi:MAG: site-specific DNA-methyltransferase [Candidatus Paceibacterota bacterium]|jgi:DNA modification methylase
MKNTKLIIKSGDLFEMGEHRLLCGSSTDAEAVKKFIGKCKIKAVVTDPPYGVAYVESKQGFKQKLGCEKIIANDHEQSALEYKDFSVKWIEPIKSFLEKKNSFYIFNSDKMIFSLRDAMNECGLKFSQLLVWVKSHAVVGRLDYLPQHELVAVGWYGTHEFLKSKDKSVLFCPKPNKSKDHPTTKPVSLIRKLILNCTRIGDYVYDGFGGSGTTLLACEQTKRKCLMIELDPQYCQTIINRYEKLTGVNAKKLN